MPIKSTVDRTDDQCTMKRRHQNPHAVASITTPDVILKVPRARLPHLRNKLHISVFDAVVNHLHIVSGADAAEVGGARSVHLSSTFRDDGRKRVVRLPRPTRHKRGAVARALFSTRDTHADKHDLFRLQLLRTALGVGEPLVATVNKDVSFLKMF